MPAKVIGFTPPGLVEPLAKVVRWRLWSASTGQEPLITKRSILGIAGTRPWSLSSAPCVNLITLLMLEPPPMADPQNCPDTSPYITSEHCERSRGGYSAWPILALLVCVAAATAGADGWAWRLVGAPCVEEIVFRAGLQARLLAHLDASDTSPGRPLVANLITAATFAGAHVAVHASALAALTALPALAIGHVFQSTRRVRHCVALHALFNALWFSFAARALASPLV